MYKRHIVGKYGEKLACDYLLKNNYKILEKNFFCKKGEIDIIAYENNYLVFIEVKTRSNFCYGKPSESVTKNKLSHIYKTAKYYLHNCKVKYYFIRFDVIEIYINKNRYRLNHIKQII